MKINVVTSSGQGSTLLSAFDNALQSAGVCNYNLIRLSSIIPPGSIVKKVSRHKTPSLEYGNRLYVVMAEIRSNEVGKFIAAGIGWYQFEDQKGLFVEHEIIGETEVAVRSEITLRIKNSLKDLCKFRGVNFDEDKIKTALTIARIKDKPSCALALAVFKSEGWN
jgi:arginine decarboxylase